MTITHGARGRGRPWRNEFCGSALTSCVAVLKSFNDSVRQLSHL